MNQATHPDPRKVGFGKVEEVMAFADRILSAANETYDDALRRLAAEWVDGVKAAIDAMAAGDALTVISVFDAVYRIGHASMPKAAYLDKYRLRAFEAYVRGDKSVDEYLLFHTVSEQLSRGNKAYLGRPLEWHSLCLARWHKNFLTGKSATAQNDYDTIRQITALLSSDLWAYEPDQNAFKHLLATTSRSYLSPAQSTIPKLHSALESLRLTASRY